FAGMGGSPRKPQDSSWWIRNSRSPHSSRCQRMWRGRGTYSAGSDDGTGCPAFEDAEIGHRAENSGPPASLSSGNPAAFRRACRVVKADAVPSEADVLEQLAELIVERLRRMPPRRLLTVAEVADYLAVDTSFVYMHADELGAERLGSGPKAPLRFRLEKVDHGLNSCCSSRGSLAEEAPATPRKRRRVRDSASGTSVRLLPIRAQN